MIDREALEYRATRFPLVVTAVLILTLALLRCYRDHEGFGTCVCLKIAGALSF
jgi:hypothetical protein